MSTEEFSLDSFLDSPPVGIDGFSGLDSGGTGEGGTDSWHEPEYSGEIDYRIRQLSYSSILTLHSCPRKFQLYKLRTTHRAEESVKSTVTFAFGHVVGEGIALSLQGLSEDEVIWKMFLGWHTDLFDQDEKLNKSFWQAVIAIKRFQSIRNSGALKDYELVYYNGAPACELSSLLIFLTVSVYAVLLTLSYVIDTLEKSLFSNAKQPEVQQSTLHRIKILLKLLGILLFLTLSSLICLVMKSST